MERVLLAVLILAVGLRVWQAERNHRELVGLLNDLATMIGELFDRGD